MKTGEVGLVVDSYGLLAVSVLRAMAGVRLASRNIRNFEQPYLTLRAAEMSVDAMLKGTQVDGVYSADPRKDKSAKRYDSLGYMDVLSRDLQVMDASAISLARENRIPIIVFDIHKPGAFAATMRGEGTFTIIKDEG